MVEVLTLDDAPALLKQLRTEGFELKAEGDALLVRPTDRLTPALREQLTRLKVALLALLRPSRRYVTLANGPTLPAEALELALDLECRGIPLHTDANHQFVMPDDERLTDGDRRAIERWRPHLSAAIEYEAPEIA
jgi:hypothetical protein